MWSVCDAIMLDECPITKHTRISDRGLSIGGELWKEMNSFLQISFPHGWLELFSTHTTNALARNPKAKLKELTEDQFLHWVTIRLATVLEKEKGRAPLAR